MVHCEPIRPDVVASTAVHQGVHLLLWQVTLVDEQFLLEDKSSVTSAADLCAESRTAAQRMLSHYVRMQGLAISQA